MRSTPHSSATCRTMECTIFDLLYFSSHPLTSSGETRLQGGREANDKQTSDVQPGLSAPRRSEVWRRPPVCGCERRKRKLPAHTVLGFREYQGLANAYRFERSMYPLSLSTRSTMTGSTLPTCGKQHERKDIPGEKTEATAAEAAHYCNVRSGDITG